jgi:hypothetical protein
MAEQFESITAHLQKAESHAKATGRFQMRISLPDPMRDRRASRTSLQFYSELLQYVCVQGPVMSKAESDCRHYLLGIRRERLRIQRVRLCLQ